MQWKGRATGGVTGRVLDAGECRRALRILADPEAGIELRALPSGKHAIHSGKAIESLIEDARLFLADGQQVYYALNPVPVTLVHSSRVDDVLNRRWLLLDIDPKKPPGQEKNSATDDEKQQARQVAEAVHQWLVEQGWPAPVIIDSGNGFHLLWRLDLPSNELVHSALKRVLYLLAERFDTAGACVDRAVHNASRIAKLPGGWAMKGACTDDRPWRPVLLLYAPDRIEVVTLDQINSLTEEPDIPVKPLEKPAAWKWRGHAAPASDHSRYAQTALDNEAARVRLASPGERNNVLNDAAFRLGTLVGGSYLDRGRVEQTLQAAAEKAGLDSGEIPKTIKSGLEAGIKKPREIVDRQGGCKSATADAAPDELVIEWASSIDPVPVEWLWPSRIPLGKLTTFAGMTSVGKTFTLLDISARVSRGLEWPDRQGECSTPGKVLFISAEDDPNDTLVPRLIEMGADRANIAFLKSKFRNKFTIGDLSTLDRALKEMGPPVRLVCIDPPTAFVGKVDDHKNAELRGLLSPLCDWAQQYRVAIVFITHFNKSTEKVAALQKVMGSVAWVNAVRAAHMFAKDPEDGTRRLFLPLKMNLCEEPNGLAYRVAPSGGLAKVEWLGEVDTTADEAAGNSVGKVKQMEAAEWLVKEIFSQKLEWRSDEFWSSAKEHGITKHSINAARIKLGMPKPRKTTTQYGDTDWIWWVPSDWPPIAPKSAKTDSDEF